MLYAIIITACLVGAPTDCREFEKRVMDLPIMPVAQFKAAEIIAGEWASQHPARKVTHIRVEHLKPSPDEAA